MFANFPHYALLLLLYSLRPTRRPHDEVAMASLSPGLRSGRGTLSDRLNPTHPHFDKGLKARWKELPKKARNAVVEADRLGLEERRREGEEQVSALPFDAEPADHCESPPEAYADVAGLLDLVANKIGKTRATLAIYDPYCEFL